MAGSCKHVNAHSGFTKGSEHIKWPSDCYVMFVMSNIETVL
jgi:hypothetical protein